MSRTARDGRVAAINLNEEWYSRFGQDMPPGALGNLLYHYYELGRSVNDIIKNVMKQPIAMTMPPVRNHRGDMLTLHDDGVNLLSTLYLGFNDSRRRRIRNSMKRQNLTHLYIGLVQEDESVSIGKHLPNGHPQFDFFDDPKFLTAMFKEVHASGIWSVPLIHMEDAPKAQRKYTQPGKFGGVLEDLVKMANPWVGEWVLGPELEEWTDKSSVLKYLEIIRAHSQHRIGLHFHGEVTTWPGTSESSFWGEVVDICGKNKCFIAYQYGFDFQVANDLNGIRDTTVKVKKRMDDLGVGFVGMEYAHPRKSPAPWPQAGQIIWNLAKAFGNG